ncbi:MAG TPA: hypothetical protein PKJ24_01195 [Prolixibacteraceae bacterium]|nr:hypothetical protein [Prolixibacteraceae bacterium]
MKNLLTATSLAIVMALMISCGGGGTSSTGDTGKKAESKGYFGKTASIRKAFEENETALKAKAKTEAKTMDDLVALQSKLNKLEEDAKAEFAGEVAKLGLPVAVSFVDSSGNADYIVKEAKITAIDWDRATIEATIELKSDSKKTMGGQNIQLTVPALMFDENNQVIKDHANDRWLILGVSKEMKAGETHQVTGAIGINDANTSLKKIVFKSYESYKKAKGWN